MYADPTMPKMFFTPCATSVSTKASLGVIRNGLLILPPIFTDLKNSHSRVPGRPAARDGARTGFSAGA